ncbi:hypothetical protein ACIREO_22395 [Streptomyces sp. NPDC102441]|uniref:hypothetical protein n=1 Tax=Streptomyces sp. NPDC102441 TaxID=3366176 RepID=UPI00380C7672
MTTPPASSTETPTRRPIAADTERRHTRHAVQRLIEQAESLEIGSPTSALVRWRATALVLIHTVCPPDHIAWQMLRPEAPWHPAGTAEAEKREQAYADGWAITRGVLEGLLPTLTEADPGPQLAEASPGRHGCQSADRTEPPALRLPGDINLVMLGAPQVQGAQGQTGSNRISRLTEYAIWLHLHPGADHHTMDDALWPDRIIRSDTRNTTTSRLRAWLGPAHFPIWTPATNYALAPSVTSDWEQFRALTAAAHGDKSLAGTRRLRAALELVQGPPFADAIRPDRYEWAAPYAVEMTAAIARAARRLTRRYLHAGDLPGARWSVQRGYRALPGGHQRHQAALEAVTDSYSEHDGLQELADQLTQEPVPMTPPLVPPLPELFQLSRLG